MGGPRRPCTFVPDCGSSARRQLQQQQAELEVHQRDGLSSYDLSQVTFPGGGRPLPVSALGRRAM